MNTIKKPDGPVELYDLTRDLGEQEDVAGEHPDVAEKLARFIDSSHREQ